MTDTADLNGPSELDTLKARARMLGIVHSPNIGLETLKAKVNAVLLPEEGGVDGVSQDEDKPVRTLRDIQISEQLALRRVRIQCLNPAKKDVKGELKCIANRYIGNVKRMIPFGAAQSHGWHIEECIYRHLKDAQFQQVTVEKVNGREQVISAFVPEYVVADLPPLTEAEMAKLGQAQLAKGGLGD